MEKRENIGICQKLFNFFTNSLVAPGVRRITTGHPASHESVEVPVEEGSRREGVLHPAKGKPEENTGSEVIVEFRHANGLLHNEDSPIVSGDQTQLQNNVEQGKKEKENDLAAQSIVKIYRRREIPLSQVQEETGSRVQGEGLRELEPLSIAIESRVRGPEKVTSFKDNVREKEKGKNIPTEKLNQQIYRKMTVPEDRKMSPHIPKRPLLMGVEPNINEKSTKFIDIKKKEFEKGLQH